MTTDTVQFAKPKALLNNFGFDQFITLVVDNCPAFKAASGLVRAIRIIEGTAAVEVGKRVEWAKDDHTVIKDFIMGDSFQFPSIPYKTKAGDEGVVPPRAFIDYMIAIRDAQPSDGPSPAKLKARRKARR